MSKTLFRSVKISPTINPLSALHPPPSNLQTPQAIIFHFHPATSTHFHPGTKRSNSFCNSTVNYHFSMIFRLITSFYEVTSCQFQCNYKIIILKEISKNTLKPCHMGVNKLGTTSLNNYMGP